MDQTYGRMEPLEAWSPTGELRWLKHMMNATGCGKDGKLTHDLRVEASRSLQQKWRSNFGNIEWRNLNEVEDDN